MQTNLKCPFCGTELLNDKSCDIFTEFWYCSNGKCETMGESLHIKVWQALIDGKKAHNRLKAIHKYLDILMKSDLRMFYWQGVVRTVYKKVKQPNQ